MMITNKFSRLLLLVLIFIFNLNCIRDKNPIKVDQIVPDFGIFFLKDDNFKIYQILNENLSLFELQSKPWISEKDIDFYDWSSHCIYLKKDKSYFFPGLQYFYRFPQEWTDRPFIFVANNLPCYAGYFSTEYSIDLYPAPYISSLEVGVFPKDVLASEWPFLNFPEPRENEVFKNALIKKGLYHGGIEVFLDTIVTPIKLTFGDTSTTVEYTICITNNDTDDLYIFDPDKVDVKYFFYYNNGPTFWNLDTGERYFGDTDIARNPGMWNSSWYTLLKSGESIERTLTIEGYDLLPIGRYQVNLRYSCPKENLSRDIRINSQGRYWLGKTHCNIVIFTIY